MAARNRRRASSPVVVAAQGAMSEIRAAKQEWSARLLAPPTPTAAAARELISGRRGVPGAPSSHPNVNVVGVGVAEKIVDGNPTGIMGVKFFVRSKIPLSQLSRKDKLPSMIDGIATDVEEVGVFHKFGGKKRGRAASSAAHGTMPNPKTRIRPAKPGSSIGFQDPANQFVMAGTFGAVVRKGSQRFVLSNNHVLADENRLPIGSPIFQPGLLDGGSAASDRIAELTAFVQLRAGQNNKVDAAIARATPQAVVSPDILYIGPPKGTAAAAIDMVVHKFGRTTSYRAGRVTSVDTDVTVQYETGTYTFVGQIIVKGLNSRSFSDAGDSGSLILDRSSNRAVALLFAGSHAYTIANHIEDVLAQFGGITLVTA